eukprot:9363779-Pyramimonas_sp.AAC.1
MCIRDRLREVDSSMNGRLPTRRVTTEDRNGLRDYITILHAGEHLSAAAATGGAISVTTCGEYGHLYTSTYMWVTISLPAEADLGAASRGADRPQIRVPIQLLHGPVHLAKLDATPA